MIWTASLIRIERQVSQEAFPREIVSYVTRALCESEDVVA